MDNYWIGRHLLGCALTLIVACQAPSDAGSQSNDSTQTTDQKVVEQEQVHFEVPEQALWADVHIRHYLQHSNITSPDSNPITYIKETRERDGRRFAVVQIGRSFDGHYATHQWIFVDSITRTIYNYDLPNDQLVEWEGPKPETP